MDADFLDQDKQGTPPPVFRADGQTKQRLTMKVRR